MGKTLSDQLVQILVDAGITRGYGVPGDAIDLVLAAIHKRDDFDFTLTRHEEGAGFMASAQAKLTGDMAVVFACQGPGAAHLLEAMYDAKFCRMWELYLYGTEMMFRSGEQMVFHMQLAHKRDAVPITRDYTMEARDRFRSWEEERDRPVRDITASGD